MVVPGIAVPGDGLCVFKAAVGPDRCTASGVGQNREGRMLAFAELRDLFLCGCDGLSDARFQGLLREGIPERRCLLQLGITMLQLLLSSPRDGSFLAEVSTGKNRSHAKSTGQGSVAASGPTGRSCVAVVQASPAHYNRTYCVGPSAF